MPRLMRLEDNEAVESIGLPCHAAVVLSGDEPTGLVRRLRPGESVDVPVLVGHDGGHVLLTPPGLARVRGLPLLAGTCRVVNGDTIECGAQVWRYVTQDFLDPERTEPLWAPDDVASGPVLCAACMDDGQPLHAGDEVVYCPACCWAFHPQCLQGEEPTACPVCSCAICRTDRQRESFMLKGQEGWSEP